MFFFKIYFDNNPENVREDTESKLYSTIPLGSINTVDRVSDVKVSPKDYSISSTRYHYYTVLIL